MNFDHRVDLLKKVTVQENWQMVRVIKLDFIMIYFSDSNECRGFDRLCDRWRSHPLWALAWFFVFLIVVKTFGSAKRIFA